MEVFESEIRKDESGRLTGIELPFNAKEAFHKSKGTIFVNGTINGIEYRSKLLSRGNGRFVMVLDKALQKLINFDGKTMFAQVTMESDEIASYQVIDQEIDQEPIAVTCNVDVLTAIKTRQSIRAFTSEPVSDEVLTTILRSGLYAPTAKNKRPYHFVVVTNRSLLVELSQHNSNASMLESSPYAVVICGDKNIEGRKEFLIADCAAATQNMLLAIHGLGLGGVWCGVASNTGWQKLLIDQLALPLKVEPIAVIAFGWPDERRQLNARWEPQKVHYNQW